MRRMTTGKICLMCFAINTHHRPGMGNQGERGRKDEPSLIPPRPLNGLNLSDYLVGSMIFTINRPFYYITRGLLLADRFPGENGNGLVHFCVKIQRNANKISTRIGCRSIRSL